jgi:nucleoside-diphosphate-sugar epimerase
MKIVNWRFVTRKWLMKVFLTGATGFVGGWVAEKLVEKGYDTICLVRKTSNLRWIEHLPVTLHYGSLFEEKSLEKGVQGVDYVLHIAAVTKALKIKEYYRGNVLATENILKICKEKNPLIKKIIHVSTQAVVGPSPSREPISEDVDCHPLTDYGKSKLESEQIVRNYMKELPITILRPPTVYGPRDTDVFEVFKNVKFGVNLKVGIKEQYVSLIHVFDLAEGIIHAMEASKGKGEIYYICNEEIYEWSEVVNKLSKIMHKKPITLPIPTSLAYGVSAAIELWANIRKQPTILNRQKIREVTEPFWTISNRKIRTELGFIPKLSLEDGLRITVEWYKENGWL